LESVFNHYVGDEFNGQLEAKFDIRQVMRGDFVQRAQAHVQLVQTGIEKISEARPEFDLGDAGPVADELYAQMQMQPLKMAGQQPALPAGNSVPTTERGGGSGVPSVAGRKYVGDVKSLMGRGQSLDDAAQLLFERNPHDSAAIREAYEYFVERTA
jgi:hypothetical protein